MFKRVTLGLSMGPDPNLIQYARLFEPDQIQIICILNGSGMELHVPIRVDPVQLIGHI